MTQLQSKILSQLATHSTASSLARSLGETTQTVQRSLRRLRNQGLVQAHVKPSKYSWREGKSSSILEWKRRD